MKLKLVLLLVVVSFGVGALNYQGPPKKVDWKDLSKNLEGLENIPDEVKFDDQIFTVNNTLNSGLQKYLKLLLRRYRTPYASIVVIDNNNGEIIGALGRNFKTREVSPRFSFTNSHPAASLFKIVSAGALIENFDFDENTLFSYNGKGTTLYKYQLKDRKNRWTRTIPLKRAFAYSNNVIFGKLGIKYLNEDDISSMASKFGFGRKITQTFKLGKSELMPIKDEYDLAEISSGFNRQTKISPVHAAYMSYLIVNEGKASPLKLIKSYENNFGKKVKQSPKKPVRQLSKKTSQGLKKMMTETTRRGTASKSFRKIRYRMRKNLVYGAKTGSITGGKPYGRHEWVTAFAHPKKNLSDKGISVAVLNVVKDRWYIRSGYLAKKVIEYYYRNNKARLR